MSRTLYHNKCEVSAAESNLFHFHVFISHVYASYSFKDNVCTHTLIPSILSDLLNDNVIMSVSNIIMRSFSFWGRESSQEIHDANEWKGPMKALEGNKLKRFRGGCNALEAETRSTRKKDCHNSKKALTLSGGTSAGAFLFSQVFT